MRCWVSSPRKSIWGTWLISNKDKLLSSLRIKGRKWSARTQLKQKNYSVSTTQTVRVIFKKHLQKMWHQAKVQKVRRQSHLQNQGWHRKRKMWVIQQLHLKNGRLQQKNDSLILTNQHQTFVISMPFILYCDNSWSIINKFRFDRILFDKFLLL